MDDNTYAEDYFCYERDLKYLNVLAATQEDVLGVMYFYGKTKWESKKNIEST